MGILWYILMIIWGYILINICIYIYDIPISYHNMIMIISYNCDAKKTKTCLFDQHGEPTGNRAIFQQHQCGKSSRKIIFPSVENGSLISLIL